MRPKPPRQSGPGQPRQRISGQPPRRCRATLQDRAKTTASVTHCCRRAHDRSRGVGAQAWQGSAWRHGCRFGSWRAAASAAVRSLVHGRSRRARFGIIGAATRRAPSMAVRSRPAWPVAGTTRLPTGWRTANRPRRRSIWSCCTRGWRSMPAIRLSGQPAVAAALRARAMPEAPVAGASAGRDPAGGATAGRLGSLWRCAGRRRAVRPVGFPVQAESLALWSPTWSLNRPRRPVVIGVLQTI